MSCSRERRAFGSPLPEGQVAPVRHGHHPGAVRGDVTLDAEGEHAIVPGHAHSTWLTLDLNQAVLDVVVAEAMQLQYHLDECPGPS